MFHKWYIFFMVLAMGTTTQAQIKLLSAKVVSIKDSTVIVGAHVVNMNTLNATNTYSDGTFLMPFEQGDTIRISSIGYEDKFIFTGTLLIPDAVQITILMRNKIYEIEGVDVSVYQSKEEFADDFKGKDIESEQQKVFKYEGPQKLEDVETDLNAHVPLGSPITFLYNKFSKEAKEQKKLSKAKKQSHKEQTIKDRYNLEVIKKVTGITSDEEAQAFMDKCPLEDEYVYSATDYDIVRSILECQEANRKENKK